MLNQAVKVLIEATRRLKEDVKVLVGGRESALRVHTSARDTGLTRP